jgi:hypothetical protein
MPLMLFYLTLIFGVLGTCDFFKVESLWFPTDFVMVQELHSECDASNIFCLVENARREDVLDLDEVA